VSKSQFKGFAYTPFGLELPFRFITQGESLNNKRRLPLGSFNLSLAGRRLRPTRSKGLKVALEQRRLGEENGTAQRPSIPEMNEFLGRRAAKARALPSNAPPAIFPVSGISYRPVKKFSVTSLCPCDDR